jgi:peptide/nickel transport system substrate-binding protein
VTETGFRNRFQDCKPHRGRVSRATTTFVAFPLLLPLACNKVRAVPRPRALLTSLMCLALVATACGGPSTAGSGEGSRSLVIALEAEPDNLNPVFGDIYGTIYGDKWPIFSGLVGYDRNLHPVPDLAAEVPEVTGTTVVVTLREDVTFHDGEPLTAEDVVFTYESILDPAVGTRLRDLLFDSLAGVRAVDEHTVEFTLDRLDPAFVDKLYIGILPAHLLEGEDLNTAEFNVAPVGTGPFRYSEWRRGERLVLEAYPDWFGGEVASDTVTFSFVPDENARAAQLTSGAVDADASSLPPRTANTFDRDGFQVVGIPGDSLAIIMPNTNPLFADPRVREAIGLAIDRQAIADGVFEGRAEPVYTPVPPGHWAADGSLTIPHDPAQARRLLADAGWTADGDTLVDDDGRPFRFTMAYSAGSAGDRGAALAVESQLGALGIAVDLESAGHAAMGDLVAAGHAALNRTGTVFDPDLDFLDMFHSSRIAAGGPFDNPAVIDDPELDAALEAARSTLDTGERIAAYARVQERVVANGGWQFLVRPQHVFVISERVEGVSPQVAEGHLHGFSRGLLWNLHEWRASG